MGTIMDNCLFCRIIEKSIPTKIVYESENIVAFNDISPQAPIHILIIPKEHIDTINNIDNNHKELLGEMLLVAKKLAKDNNIADDGYRLIFNRNNNGGQAVYHIHLHLLGGRQMKWPPG